MPEDAASPARPKLLVVGSINMDLVVRVQRRPEPGETLIGEGFVTSPGGKGANQAVASARLGADCRMIGRVGNDDFGQTLIENLRREGVDTEGVLMTDRVASGVALITVDGAGENAIVVASGANAALTPDDVFAQQDAFEWAEAVVLQLELPLPTVRAAVDLARRCKAKVVLDPAPAPEKMCDALFNVDVISPNVSEAEILTDRKALEERVDKLVAADLIARGAGSAVLKLGSRGSLVVVNDGHCYRVPSYKISVVDTTAAGDAFTAALSISLARGEDFHQAAKFANAAGALACTRLGAQNAMPTAEEVQFLMADQPLG